MEFLDDLELDCVICKEHFYYPILTPCGHHFCKDCILNWIEMNDYPSCPICKKRFPFYFAEEYIKDCDHDYFLDNIVKSKCKVNCLNKENGCDKKILPKELNKHNLKCLFKKVKCINYKYGCDELVIRNNLIEHKLVCNYNPCLGNKYGCTEIGTEAYIEQHNKKCIYNILGHNIEKRILEKFENILTSKINEINEEKHLNRLSSLPLPPDILPQVRRPPLVPLNFLRTNRFNNDNTSNNVESNNVESTHDNSVRMRFLGSQIRNELFTQPNNSIISSHPNVVSMRITTPRLQELSREMLGILNQEVSNRLN